MARVYRLPVFTAYRVSSRASALGLVSIALCVGWPGILKLLGRWLGHSLRHRLLGGLFGGGFLGGEFRLLRRSRFHRSFHSLREDRLLHRWLLSDGHNLLCRGRLGLLRFHGLSLRLVLFIGKFLNILRAEDLRLRDHRRRLLLFCGGLTLIFGLLLRLCFSQTKGHELDKLVPGNFADGRPDV